MSLVVCKHCGKKISSTLDKCFFCNKSLKNDFISKINDESKKYKKYSSLSKEELKKLEKEFANSSEKTIKHMQKFTAVKRFLPTFIIALIYFILFYNFGSKIVGKLKLIQVYNEYLFISSIIVAFSALVLITFTIIAVGVVNHKASKSINNYIFLKKYITWLKEEKNIFFSLDFLTSEAREKLEQIDLETMDL